MYRGSALQHMRFEGTQFSPFQRDIQWSVPMAGAEEGGAGGEMVAAQMAPGPV